MTRVRRATLSLEVEKKSAAGRALQRDLILIKAVPQPFVVIQALALPIQIFRSKHDDSCDRGEE
jgi:hypothetical protein